MAEDRGNGRGRVLLVDDDEDLCRLLARGLDEKGFRIAWQTSANAALATLDEDDFEVLLTDLDMPDVDGLELCTRVVGDRPDVPVVVLTAFGDFESAVSAIRAGAYDFITKPPRLEALSLALDRAVRHRQLQIEVKRLRHAIDRDRVRGDIIAASAGMRAVLHLVDRVADSDASVLITGETGTGKELIARALHRGGRWRHGPFVAVNCAAVPAALLESELFGHVRGAFTDARTDRPGLFPRASGGTVFLDEIAELPLTLQPKLLRAVQERTVRPVGSDDEIPFDARIVAATNDDLAAAIRERRFREDLYFRVNVIPIALPPLRAREHDVLLLAQHFLERCAARSGRPVIGLSPAAAERMLAYAWPGNVRELQNCIERAVALAHRDHIGLNDLPEPVRRARGPTVLTPQGTKLLPLVEVERGHVLAILEATRGNRKLAAQILGLDRKTLYRRLMKYGVT